MAISGSLCDVSVADVMQFVYLGRRTGTLHLSRRAETASFVFDEGRLVRARSQHSQNLGDLLLQRGYLDPQDLLATLADRSAGSEIKALGQLLLDRQLVAAAQLGEALEVQIQQAINGVLNWEEGDFDFHAGEVEAADDFRALNEILVPRDGFNPQLLLLEAAHIFDQRGEAAVTRGRDGTAPAAPRQSITAAAAMGEALRTTEGWLQSLDAFFAETGGARTLTELWWVSQDAAFFRGLSEALAAQPVQTRRVTGASATRLDPSGPEPIILVDLRGGGPALCELEALRRSQIDATLLAIVGPAVDAARVFAAGAQAMLPADPSAIVELLEQLLAEPGADPGVQPISAGGVQRLRRVYQELRAGQVSATVALTLMRLISESFDRAVLFRAKRDSFSVLGAFGAGAGGRPLALATRRLVLPNNGDDIFSRTARSGALQRVEPTRGSLPAAFHRLLGGEPLEQPSLFPVGGAERVIALVYADHYAPLPDEDIQILELAAAQVGTVLENELLSRGR